MIFPLLFGGPPPPPPDVAYLPRSLPVRALRFDGTNATQFESWSDGRARAGMGYAGPIVAAIRGAAMQVAHPGDWIVIDATGAASALTDAAFRLVYGPPVPPPPIPVAFP